MSTNRKKSLKGGGQPRRISVRAVRREQPDLRKLSRALIALALEQAATEAAAQAQAQQPPEERTTGHG